MFVLGNVKTAKLPSSDKTHSMSNQKTDQDDVFAISGKSRSVKVTNAPTTTKAG